MQSLQLFEFPSSLLTRPLPTLGSMNSMHSKTGGVTNRMNINTKIEKWQNQKIRHRLQCISAKLYLHSLLHPLPPRDSETNTSSSSSSSAYSRWRGRRPLWWSTTIYWLVNNLHASFVCVSAEKTVRDISVILIIM